MYRDQTQTRIKKLLFWTFIVFIGIQASVLWFELADEINSKFQNYYNNGFSDEYIKNIYSPNFSKDPFWDAITNTENKSMQLKIAWSKNIENILWEMWCNLSQKKIRWILYYFVPEFRTELARSLKQELWDYDSKKYIFDEDTIQKYCEEYYKCELSAWLSARSVYKYRGMTDCDKEKGKYDSCINNCSKKYNGSEYDRCMVNCDNSAWKTYNNCMESIEYRSWIAISSNTPKDVMSNCQEFFQKNYEEWQRNEWIKQNVESAEAWADRYWNESTEDSPYDIMNDLWVLAKLLYRDAQEPITPVFYNIPVFSNSKKKLNDKKSDNWKTSADSSDPSTNDNWWDQWPASPSWWNGWVSLGWGTNNPQGLWNDNPNNNGWGATVTPISPTRNEWWYDRLIEWLNAYSIVNDNSHFYRSLCEDEEPEPEAEPETKDQGKSNNKDTPDIRSLDDLSIQEYQDLVDYMRDSVNKYSDLPDDLAKEIEKKAWDTSRYISDETAEQLKSSADSIKNCRKSCDGLRIDQKASCMLKCACGEVKSSDKPLKLFDPEEFPWLWPIFVIRFCSVPAVDTRFSVGWKRIHSIEEWLNEIYWAVDKLSREWRLWKWTQENEFLDSSTRQMKIADTFAFSIDIEFVDIWNKMPTHSQQYKDREIAKENSKWQATYLISNPINNPVTKNRYRLIWKAWEMSSNVTDAANTNQANNAINDLNISPEPLINLNKNSDANRYNTFEEYLWIRMDQQWTLWNETLNYVMDLDYYADMLYQKKCDTN